MLIAFLMNMAILASSALFVARYFTSESRHYRLLALSTLVYAQIILIQLFWGVLGKLYLANLVISAFLIFFICLLLFRKGPASLTRQGLMPGNKIVLFCFSVILGFGIVKTAINLFNSPFGWDSLNYHFTFPVEWLKQANLRNPITINDDLGPPYYPINGSLIYFWLMAPLRNVFLADIGQIPFFVIAFLAVYGISRLLNISREFSFYAAAVFTITPNYLKQAEIAYVDVMVCAWFLVSAYFLLFFYQQNKARDALLFSAGLGMLIGTKTTALPFSALLLIIFLALILLRSRDFGFRKTSLLVLAAILLAIIFGGYGYIRNSLEAGNPLYPMKIEFFGREIFKGVYDKANYSVRVASADYSFSKILFHEGMGAGAIIFLLPGILLFGIMAAGKRAFRPDRFLIFLLSIAIFFIWRYVIPLANLRYLYPGLALGYIVSFSAFSDNKPRGAFARALVVLCFLASCAEIANHLELVFSLLISAILFFVFGKMLLALLKLKTGHWAILAVSLFFPLYFLNKDYDKNEYKSYVKMVKYSGLWPDAAKAWAWLNENTKGNNIAYVGRPVPFPLYGTNFKNNVFYVSVNTVDPVKAHYFPQSRYRWGADFLDLHKSLEAQGNYRQHPEYAVWLNNLKRRSAEYLFVYSLHQTKEIIFPLEDAWAAEHPDRFILSFANESVHIYKISNSALTSRRIIAERLRLRT